MNSLPLPTAMDRAANSDDDLRVLQILCGKSASREQRLEIVQSLYDHVFRDPEHQVVFESIRSILSRGVLSADRLAMHLNNRGFPDVELKRYFPASSENGDLNESAAPEKQ
jgi:hypothetical protein